MQVLKHQIRAIFEQAFSQSFPDLPPQAVEVTQSTNPNFGHYQCNNAMRLTKLLGQSPRDIAQKVVDTIQAQNLDREGLFEQLEIAGPGFINISLNPLKVGEALDAMFESSTLGVATVNPQRIIVDFSSPNTAKEMHVGHLRSTIIGDCICRVLEFMGHDVLRLNHIGDWGTQFGMLITYLKEHVNPQDLENHIADLSMLVQWYKASKKQFDEDEDFKKRSQEAVVALQGGDQEALKLWQLICEISSEAYHKVYDLMDVKIIDRGESYYNPLLGDLVRELEDKNLIEVSEGAKCIYVEGFKNRDGEPLPFMVQKSDGGFNYATTDLAALKHRVEDEHGDRLIYVIDSGQGNHMQMLFEVAKKAGYVNPAKVRCDHVGFGVVLGPDGKKFKTRSGETVRLMDLLEGAVAKAKAILIERQKDAKQPFTEEEIDNIAHCLGIGAVKYADLSGNRNNDYTFSFDRMLQFEGNTAAFLMYSYVRVEGIKRKIGKGVKDFNTVYIDLAHPSEMVLGVKLRQFSEVLETVADDLMPNRLCEYLFDVAEKFNAFFRDCRVEGTKEQEQRLKLCELTAKVLKTGLNLLGVKAVSRM